MEIVGNVKNYDWGKLGSKSIVAELAALNATNDFKIDEKLSYAELWMGDHVSGPSHVKATNSPLSNHLKQSLPFLFKVLSIRKALSIQVHPNKAEAERLHKERPDIYKDANHKPELAIALTPFLALCGFRPHAEIYSFCQALPPLLALLGGEVEIGGLTSGDPTKLRDCYAKLMNSPTQAVSGCVQSIIEHHSDVLKEHGLAEIFAIINRDFPEDVGILSLFFLNILRLQPGEAIFLAANEIHAYLDGDCIECMACSDNVIRAGLTPKYKDVAQLIACLNYAGQAPAEKVFQPRVIDANLKVFAPPVDDFAVAQIKLTDSEYKMQLKPYASILFVLEGKRMLILPNQTPLCLQRGSIVFIPPESAHSICFKKENNSESTNFTAYLASYNFYKA